MFDTWLHIVTMFVYETSFGKTKFIELSEQYGIKTHINMPQTDDISPAYLTTHQDQIQSTLQINTTHESHVIVTQLRLKNETQLN